MLTSLTRVSLKSEWQTASQQLFAGGDRFVFFAIYSFKLGEAVRRCQGEDLLENPADGFCG